MRMRQSAMSLSQYERSWLTHWKQSGWSALASATARTMSRECASMVIMFMIFWRSGLARSVRVTSISLVSCLTCAQVADTRQKAESTVRATSANTYFPVLQGK